MNNPINDLSLLKVFSAVASFQSLKKAAEHLSVTPSAVSQSLKTLEDSLGLTLVDRSVRPIRLTDVGRRLSIQSRPLLEQAEMLHARLCAESLEKLNLRLGLTESVMETIGPWLLNELSEKLAAVSTFSSFTSPMLRRLEDDSLDVILSPNALFDQDRWERRLLYEEELLIVTDRSVSTIDTVEEWMKMALSKPLICYNNESSDQVQIDRIVRSLGVEPKRFAAVSSSYALVGLVTQKKGWTVMPPSNLWPSRHFLDEINCFPMPASRRVHREMWVVGDKLIGFGRFGPRDRLSSIQRENASALSIDSLPTRYSYPVD